jgi:phage terminase Nu1 subunit (DNA packaging protein)
MPHVDGRFDLVVCLKWYVRFLQEALRSRPVPEAGAKHGTIVDARRRKLDADASMAELNLARERSQLVSIRDVEFAWSEIILSAKARLLAVPARAAPKCIGESRSMISAVIEKELKEALTVLAKDDVPSVTNRTN